MTKLFKGLWHGLDITRKVILNIMFFLILIWFIAIMLSSGDQLKVEKGVALVLKPNGNIVEQLTYKDPIDAALQEATGNDDTPETSLYDLIEAVEQAKDDSRITALVISTKYMSGAGVTKLQDLGIAIEDFKRSGKKVIAFDDNFSQAQFYLASKADQVYMNPQGGVFLTGFSTVGTYFKSLFELLEINMHVFKVGKFKSAVEPFIRDNMSEEAKEANRAWLGDLWTEFTKDLASSRSLTSDDITTYIDSYREAIIEYKGDSAKLAFDKGLVDELMTRIQFRQYMVDLVGEDAESKSFKQISHKSYLKAIRAPFPFIDNTSDKVAVITTKGAILDGEHKEGKIGGDTVARLIRKTRQNSNVKAIVLRVDSGGGSAFASEVIREELVKAQESGIKVIASMGDVAASGGYWISATSDEIWAKPATITGSIGIFGMFPTFEKPMNRYGIFRDGVGTTKYANPFDVGQPLDQEVKDIIQTSIDSGYEKFLALVGKGRNMTREQVDAIAQGRVWSGKQAHELGLVDKLGSLNDAIESAAKLAGLDNYDTLFVKRKLSEKEIMLKQILGSAGVQDTLTERANTPRQQSLTSKFVHQISNAIVEVEMWNDPNHAYANCMCNVQ